MKKKLMVSVLAAALLVGCSEEAVKEETKAVEKEEVTKPKEEAKPPAEKEPIDTSGYAEEMSDAMSNLSGDLGDFSQQNVELSKNPYLKMDKDWLIETAMTLTYMEVSIDKIKSIEVPDVPELKEAHNLVMKAMDHYQFTVDNYPDAIDNMDTDLLQECTANMERANGYIQGATDIIIDYQNKM